VDCVLARDVGDALFAGALKRLIPGQKGKKRTFLFEMHEILYAMHQHAPGRRDWRATMEREKRILRRADGLVLLNSALEKPARESLGFTGPLIVEPNGFNPALFFPLPLLETGHPWPGPQDPVTLAYSGSLRRDKGVPELVRAMGKLPERFRLRIIGGGSDTAVRELEELRAAIPGGGERIRFTGQVSPGAVRSACAGAHIAVIPQQPDSDFFSPIKLFEYLALGLPVICTPLELFRDNQGTVHLAGDATAQGIASAAEELAANPALAGRLRVNGLQAAAARTWKARAARILDFAASLR
jgi:glycosyltransferase involved in cell wall biosynthesis